MEDFINGGQNREQDSRREYGNRNEARSDRSYGSDRPQRSYSREGKTFKLRHRKGFGGEQTGSESNQTQRTYSSERRNYGERTERRSFGGNRSYDRGNGENRGYGENRPRRNYGEGRNFSEGGERRSYGERSERRSYGENSERRSYTDRQEGRTFEKRNFGERPSRNYGDRPYSDSRNGERRPFDQGRGRKTYNNEGRSFDQNSEGREFGQKKSFAGKGPHKNFSGGKSFGNRPSKTFGNRTPRKFDNRASIEGISRMINSKPVPTYSTDDDMAMAPIKDTARLNKFIANSGVCSRREADNLILAGVVTVNGEVVTELGTKINIYTDDIRFNGERLKGEEKVYIVMNKPKGFVTTASDPHAEKTVMDLLKSCTARVFPVGRLDKNTTGVLMFTNDGEMAEKLTHPSYDKKKIYQVDLSSQLRREDYDKIKEGIVLSDGVIAADELEYIDEADHRKIGIEIHSGKNRIVRRIFESLGYEVKALDRVYFAGLTKKGIKRGLWRYLSEGEVNILKMGAYR